MASRLHQIAFNWALKHPHLKSRIERAVALVGGVKSQCEGVYVVEGSKGVEYIVAVDFEKGTSICTCTDHKKGNHCKHRLAVALVCVLEREVFSSGRSDRRVRGDRRSTRK